MFYVLYFFMTGLHALHMVIGIGLMGIMAYLSYHRWFSGGGETQIEVAGLYWHFVEHRVGVPVSVTLSDQRA